MSLKQIAQRWDVRADAALLRLGGELDRATHVPVVSGQPRELWFPPEAIMRAQSGQGKIGSASV
ncbi:hypothetical protein [Deinococcus arenicola]|uniref:Uncharacterized protein n=1 Tax=Deinococcus arenicola TaxID=2994950 RepID=A0ABU4DVF9_9DEIO|nr:hypothetical protein [Deinococcus sp. ZS9-10]MDV6376435.1 hypothetical protein [Deinococcus sp. ZS9-10]